MRSTLNRLAALHGGQARKVTPFDGTSQVESRSMYRETILYKPITVLKLSLVRVKWAY